MTDLRQALRTAVATPPTDHLDLVAVVASGRRARGRRRRWLTAAMAAATATAVIAGVAAVAAITGDGGDRGAPEPVRPDRTHRTERAIDPVAPPRNFAVDPVRGFEADAPLLREGDVVLGGPDDNLGGGYLTEDLRVLVDRWDGSGYQYGLVDPAAPSEIDWLPVSPGYVDHHAIPLCGVLADDRGDCVQGRRTLWFYLVSDEQGEAPGSPMRIETLRFDRLTRHWSQAPRPPRSALPDPAVTARVVDISQLVVTGPAGRHVVHLDRAPICDRRDNLVLGQAPEFEVPTVQVEGQFVVVRYNCSVLFDPGSGEYGMAIYDARGRLLVHPAAAADGSAADGRVVDGRLFNDQGMVVDLVGGRVYRLLRNEPHVTVSNWLNAYAWVRSFRAGLVIWSEFHPDPSEPWKEDLGERTLHLTPLPGG